MNSKRRIDVEDVDEVEYVELLEDAEEAATADRLISASPEDLEESDTIR